jgi:hypothetical protein
MFRRLPVLVTLLLGACARAATPAAPSPGGSKLVPIVATAELRGTTEPCGCNSDPLGDLARLVALARSGLLVDAGNQLYDVTVPDATRAQADRKADAIGSIYEDASAEVALGPNDLQGGIARLRPPRQACNLILSAGLAAPQVRTVGGLRIGVFGVTGTAPKLPPKTDIKLTVQPGAEAARRAIATLEHDHAEVIVALLAMPRGDARALLQAAPGVDFAIVGVGTTPVEEGMVEPEPVGGAWLVQPADQGRRAAKIEIARGDGPAGTRLKLARYDGEAGRALRLSRLDRRKAALGEQLASFRRDPAADPAFVAAREKELTELTAERDRLTKETLTPPPAPFFTYTLQPIKQSLPRDPSVAAALRKLARDNGRANLEAAQKEPAPPPVPGQPRYVGVQACARCHKAAATFWQKSHHADAWKTLVAVDKQYDYDCVGCHVTGWQEPGGSHLASVEKLGLESVQCEVCHGPGSKHVEEDGMDSPLTIRKAPAEDLCRTRCHTQEHSDTFQLEAYLRDVTGAGHGAARRTRLGDGPTGHELRQQALAAAKR